MSDFFTRPFRVRLQPDAARYERGAMMKRPITMDATSAASATTALPAIIAVTRPGERGTAENDRIDFAVNIQRYAVHSVTTTGKLNNSSGLRLNAANSSAATTM
jgi:hypothetical protein